MSSEVIMRTPSRLMFSLQPTPSIRDKVLNVVAGGGIILLFVSALLYMAWQVWPMVGLLLFCGAIFMSSLPDERRRRREGRRLSVVRSGESICHFARSFKWRQVDSWIIRATWEILQPYVPFPVRSSDTLEQLVGNDDEEQWDLLEDIARVSGRTLTEVDEMPRTVEQLVLLLNSQPATVFRRQHLFLPPSVNPFSPPGTTYR